MTPTRFLKRLDEIVLEVRAIEKRHASRLQAIERRLYDLEHQDRGPLRVGPPHELRTHRLPRLTSEQKQELTKLARKLGLKVPAAKGDQP